MTQVDLKANVKKVTRDDIFFEFGPTQAEFRISANGNAARKLKLMEKQKVTISISTD